MNETKGTPLWVYILTGFTILGISAGLFYYLMRYTPLGQKFGGSTDTVDESTSSPSNGILYEEFTGEFVTTPHPKDWKVVEITDESGSDMIMGGNVTYDGLLALKVTNTDGKELFTLKAVDGIGGLAGCEEVYKFSDTDEDYLKRGNDVYELSGITPEVVDLSTEDYSEIIFFEWYLRRIDTDIYRNMVDELEGFNAACGVDKYFEIGTLGYVRKEGEEETYRSIYYMEIAEDISAEDMEELDVILGLIEPV